MAGFGDWKMSGLWEKRLRLAAYGVTALLVLQLIWGAGRLMLLSAPEAIPPAAASLQVDPVNFPAADVDGSSDIVQRPLFWQGRQPPVSEIVAGADEPPEVAAKADTVIDKMKLLGVFGGESPGAIVASGGKQSRLQVNESIEDWTLAEVSPNSVVFVSGDDFRILVLEQLNPTKQKATKKAKTKRRTTETKS
jgi:hypothetical protein